MMKQNLIESSEKANELAKKIGIEDAGISSVEIIDEPGHAIGGYVQDGLKDLRSITKEAWRNAGFEQTLFFSGRSSTDSEALVLIRKDEYEVFVKSAERGIIVVVGVDRAKRSISDVSAIIKKIHEILDGFYR